MVPAPHRLNSLNLPLKPFRYSLWLYIILYLVAEIIILCWTHHMQLWIKNRLNDTYEKSWGKSFRFAYVTTLKLFLNQGSNLGITSTSTRTLLFSIYAVDIIITSIYGGGLASVLTLPM